MKKVFFSITLIAAAVFTLTIAGCKNFMGGSEYVQDLQNAIDYQNSSFCKVTLKVEDGTGSMPNASVYTDKYKPTDSIPISFEPKAAYKFLYWTAEPAGSVTFENDDIRAMSTTATLAGSIDGNAVVIIPHCVQRPVATLQAPSEVVSNPKNSNIIISFNEPLDIPESYLKNIKIELNGEDISDYFDSPVLQNSNYEIRINSRSDKILDYSSNEDGTVSVTIPQNFYYKAEDGTEVQMAEETVKEYPINKNTAEKLSLKLKKNRYGDLDTDSSLEKNILETQVINYTLNPGCYFNCWKISTESIDNEAEGSEPFTVTDDEDYEGTGTASLIQNSEGKSILRVIYPSDTEAAVLEASSIYRITLEVLSSYSEDITITPDAYERPTVTVSAVSSTSTGGVVPKNTSILVKFNKTMSNIEEMVDEIKIEVDGESVLDHFEAPVIENDNQITFDADMSNLIDTENTTKTVKVTVPKEFSYTDNGTEVNLGEDVEYTYKINAQTSLKGDFIFSNGNYGKTKVNRTGSYSCNIGESVTFRVTSEDSSYQFAGWYVSNDNEGGLPTGCLNIEADDADLSVTLTVLKQVSNVEVHPLYYARPMIASLSPSTIGNNTVCKDRTIILSFASPIDEEYVDQITITKSGEDITACFKAPEFKEVDGCGVVTFEPDYDNLMTVNGSSEAVVVNVPEDISYTIENDESTDEDDIVVTAGVAQSKSYRVKPETDKKLNISFVNNSDGGSMNYVGTYSVSMGDSLTAIYSTAAGFNFTGWSVTDCPEVVYDSDELTQKRLTLTAIGEGSVIVTGGADFSPEITDYEPKYNVNGVECDTTVTVTFNTLMDHSTINKSNISITNKKTGDDLSDYFVISSRDVNGVTLSDFKVDESITGLFSSNALTTYDIRIVFNQANVKSTEESNSVSLTGTTYDWYYRINSGTETVLPHLTEIHLYKTKNDDGTYSDELSTASFDEWSSNVSYFNLNHINKAYLTVSGYDADSGLSHVNLTQSLYKTTIGTDSQLEAETSKMGSYTDFKDTGDTVLLNNINEVPVYSYESEVNFSTSYPDGVMKLEFTLEDRAGNKESTKTYYVLRDTGVDGSTIKDSGLLGETRLAENGIDTVYCKFESLDWGWKQMMIDTFYDDGDNTFKDELTVKKFEWGYSIDDSMNVVEPAVASDNISLQNDSYVYSGETYYSFQRDETRETYLRITVEDSVGNTYQKTAAIPEKAIYIGYRYQPMFKAFNENCPVDYSYAYIYIYDSDDSEDDLSVAYRSNYDIREDCHLYNGAAYIVAEFEGKYSKFSNRYDFNGWDINGTYSRLYETGVTADDITDSEMPSDLELTTTVSPAIKNSCFTEVRAVYPSDFVKSNSDLAYLVAVRKDGYTGYTYTEGEYLHLFYGNSYWICPAAMNKEREFKYGKEVKITINDDTTPPEMSSIGVNNGTQSYYQTSPNFVKVTVPTDESGMQVQNDGLVHLQYWIIANESVESYFKEREESDIIQYPSHEITYDPSDPPSYLRIPLDDSPENSYTVYVKLVDGSANQNYKFISIYAYNVLREKEASFTFDEDYQLATSSFNIGFYDSFHDGSDFDEDWWTEKGYIDYWHSSGSDWYVDFPDEETEEKVISEFMEDHFTYESQKAFLYKLDDTDMLVMTAEVFEDGTWDHEIASETPTSHCKFIAFTENGRVQFISKGGLNWCYNDSDGARSSSFYTDCAGKFVRFLSLDAADSAGTISNYWKTLYVYPDYYKNLGTDSKISCNNKNMMELKNGLQIFADAPVFVHTYHCSSDLGEDVDLWLNHGLETGCVQKSSGFTYGSSYLEEVPEGYYYTTIAHFADGTTIMSDVKQK